MLRLVVDILSMTWEGFVLLSVGYGFLFAVSYDRPMKYFFRWLIHWLLAFFLWYWYYAVR